MLLEKLEIPKKKIETLASRGICSVESLLYSKPKRYLFFDKTYPLVYAGVIRDKIENAIPFAIKGKCTMVENEYKREKNMSLIKMRVTEEKTGKTLFVNCIGMYHMLNYFNMCENRDVIVGGKVQYSPQYESFSMMNPLVFSKEIEENNRIIPVYRKYKGISEEYYIKSIEDAITAKGEDDYLEENLRNSYHLLSYKETVNAIHHPESEEIIKKANQRIVFDDMLYFTCKLEQQRSMINSSSLYTVKTSDKTRDMIGKLPFELTEGQDTAVKDMINTAKRGERVSALIQGDVGSGKTIVAFSMMMVMAENNYQSVLMAPTTVLAKQHYLELVERTKEYGFKAVLLSNELTTAQKKEVLKQIASGEADFIVGTHSCISKSVEYANLGLTITDEEHKFGVMQRDALVQKAKDGVHSITMSGTPIPRTLASTLYGDSTKVYSLQLPSNRKPIQTAICSSNKPVFEWVEKQINMGHQAYVVCPLIDEAEEDSKMQGVASIEETAKIYENYFSSKGVKLGIVTGKTSNEDAEQIMKDFKENKIQILISTTVIEVGVNNPNATVIVITGAERFGLATLHQLRGRVGRGGFQSYCILQKSPNATSGSNLEVLCRETDGLEISKEDLKNRGTGNLIGSEQSGKNSFIDLMLTYPNMYEKVKEIAKELCRHHKEEPFIEKYEEYFIA